MTQPITVMESWLDSPAFARHHVDHDGELDNGYVVILVHHWFHTERQISINSITQPSFDLKTKDAIR